MKVTKSNMRPLAALTSFLMISCSGGGGSSPPSVSTPIASQPTATPAATIAPTSSPSPLAPSASVAPSSSPVPTATPSAAPTSSPTPSPVPTPSPSPSPVPTPSPTPTQFAFIPATVDFANVEYDQNAPPPSSLCPSPNGPNVVCFNGYGQEVDPSQLGYSIGSGRWNPTTSNPGVAVSADCAYNTYPYAGPFPCSGNPRSIIVYPTGIGSASISVQGGSGLTGSFPVTVSTSNVAVAVSGLPQATYMNIRAYRSSDRSMLFGTGISSITNPASNPTVYFYNIALPVNVSMFIQVTVSNGLQIYATSTIYNQFLAPQATHSISMAVSPTTQ